MTDPILYGGLVGLSKRKKILEAVKGLPLPLLASVFPVLFIYGNNVMILLLPSLGRTALFYAALAVTVYFIGYAVYRGDGIRAANAAVAFLFFFHLYGVLYDFLLKNDWFAVDHYTLLPFFLLCAAYASWLAARLPPKAMWNGSFLILSGLVLYNLTVIVSGEWKKNLLERTPEAIVPMAAVPTGSTKNPDIFFIIFDEFAGLDVARNYWHYSGVDDFVDFVESRGFYVMEDSRSSTTMTLHQICERLNFKEYPCCKEYTDIFYADLKNNYVMTYLKSLGYTTILFEEIGHFWEAFPQLPVDYSFGYEESKSMDLGLLFDEFGSLVADQTMLRVFSGSTSPSVGFR